MNRETLYCDGCSNSVTLRGPGVYQVEAACGQCGSDMTPEE